MADNLIADRVDQDFPAATEIAWKPVENLPTGVPLVTARSEPPYTHLPFPGASAPRLLIPTHPKAAAATLAHFLPPSTRLLIRVRRLARALRGQVRPAGFAGTAALDHVRQLAGQKRGYTGISLGTPGPYRKQTVLIMNSAGVPVALAKVATTPDARQLLHNEAKWLRRLAAHDGIAGQIPRLIVEDQAEDIHVVVQSIGGTGHCHDRTLLPDHLNFLSAIQAIVAPTPGYLQSAMRSAMRRRIETLAERLEPAWVKRSRAALAILDDRLGSLALPMVAAHRDFVRWNMRRSTHGRFVYDWEYASTGYLPLYDLFHFMLMPTALRRPVTPADAQRVVRNVLRLGLRTPPFERKLNAPETQLVGYLLDLCLFYLDSNGGHVAGSKVVERYGNLIDNFETWSRP